MSWSDHFLSTRGIRNVCRRQLLAEIFSPLKAEKEWKILIVDEFALKILSCCFDTEEVTAFNICLIDLLDKTRESVAYMSAIYLLFPSSHNITLLNNDFISTPPKYMNSHLFFLTSVPDQFYNTLATYTPRGHVLTFKEIDILFLPSESQVFLLDDQNFFSIYFDAYKELDLQYCENLAQKLASVCITLNISPRIRYRRDFVKNLVIAEALQRELEKSRDRNQPSSSEVTDNKPPCEILIIDRGFDCVSPLVHECTLQAMAMDLLNIQDDVYEYADEKAGASERAENRISLTESDPLWCNLRHEHIANVSRIIDKQMEAHSLLRRYPKAARLQKLPDLGNAVKKHLAFRKQQPQVIIRRLANDCMKIYCDGINLIANVERDLVDGCLSEKSASKNVLPTVHQLLCSPKYTMTEKLRLLLLYIFHAKGVTKQEFDEFLIRCDIPFSKAHVITNVLHLDVDIFKPGHCKPFDYIRRKQPDDTPDIIRSRWVPAIKNVMLSCVDGSLSEEKYPFLDDGQEESARTRRSGYWFPDKTSANLSRLIVFIAGGITYSEMRTAYEVMSLYKGWEIYIGGDCFLTPNGFLNKLEELRCFIKKE